MKVGIRADLLGSQLGGAETYVRNVIGALGVIDPAGDYTLFLGTPLSKGVIPSAEHMRQVVIQNANVHVRLPFLPSRSAFADWWLPSGAYSRALVREHIDVVHVQYADPFLFPARMVVSLHDIAYERYPQFFTPDFVTKLRIRVPATLRRASAVLTLSEFSRQDIMRRYCVPPEKVVVTPLAADPIYAPVHDVTRLDEVRLHYGTGESFILCVGDLQPRKNLKTLIAAYIRLRQADAIRHKLVLVGRAAWLFDDIFAAARDSRYAGDIVFTGYVPNEDLAALYSAAELFVYPSLFEGFGLPLLEAMACGTPVVTSNTSSLPEVVGDAGVMVDPLDVEGLASAISLVLENAMLRTQLVTQGLERAATFTWTDTARTIREVYHSVALK